MFFISGKLLMYKLKILMLVPKMNKGARIGKLKILTKGHTITITITNVFHFPRFKF